MAQFKLGDRARIERGKDYGFAPCAVIIRAYRDPLWVAVQIVEAEDPQWVCERMWLVLVEDLSKCVDN